MSPPDPRNAPNAPDAERQRLLAASIGSQRLFDALADDTRRVILALLARSRPLSVTRIMEEFECVSQPTISYHLRVLREAGLVGSVREGNVVYYGVERRLLWKFLDYIVEIYGASEQ